MRRAIISYSGKCVFKGQRHVIAEKRELKPGKLLAGNRRFADAGFIGKIGKIPVGQRIAKRPVGLTQRKRRIEHLVEETGGQGFIKKKVGRNIQRTADGNDHLKTGRAVGALDIADISAGKIAKLCELLLSEMLFQTLFANGAPETDVIDGIHRAHPIKQRLI